MPPRTYSLRRVVFVGAAAILAVLSACSADTSAPSTSTSDVDAAAGDDASGAVDAASANDAAPASRSSACTPLSQENGTIVDTTFGRLDGTLVYVVGVGQGHACNGDSSHVHLQVEVSGNVYDVAVDIGTTSDEVGLDEETVSVPDGVWAEGWHGSDQLGYRSLGLHSSSFPLTTPNALGSQLVSLLETTSTISIFCTGYSQGNGCHDVHYKNGSGDDGAIVLNPTTDTSATLFFRFSSQSF